MPAWESLLPAPPTQYGPDLGKAAAIQGQQQKNQLVESEIQGRNMLAQLYQTPDALDPNTGMLKPQAVNRLAQAGFVDTAMEYMKNAANLQRTQQASALAGVKVRDENRSWLIESVAAPSVSEYDRVLSSTGSSQQAQAAAQRVYSENLDRAKSEGRLSAQEIQQLSPAYIDSNARSNVYGAKELQRQREHLGTETRAEEHLGLERERVAREEKKEAREEGGKWEVRVDSDGTNYRYNVTTGEATTLDKKPYEAKAAGKVGTAGAGGVQAENLRLFAKEFRDKEGRDPTAVERASFMVQQRAMPRSGPAAAMQKWIQENPKATADEYQAHVAEISAQMSATRQFLGAGQRSQAIRRFSVADSHLDVLNETATALAQHDMPALNLLQNAMEKQFGHAGPVEFDAVKKLVGTEVEQAVLGAAGTGAERQAIQDDFNKANSPAQLAGVTKSLRRLIGGQLDGYRREFKAETKLGDEAFDRLLSDAALRDLPAPGGAHSTTGGVPAANPQRVGASAGSAGLPADLPPVAGVAEGSKVRDDNGKVVAVLRGGQWVSP